MNLFGVGPAEAALVFVIALIVVGPQRFPEIMRNAGRWYRVARAYSNEVMKDVRGAIDDIEREVKTETEGLRSVTDLADVRQDLIEAKESAEDVKRDTRAAASGTPAPRPATPKPVAPAEIEEPEAAIEDEPPAEEPEAPSYDPFQPRKAGTRRTTRRAGTRDNSNGGS